MTPNSATSLMANKTSGMDIEILARRLFVAAGNWHRREMRRQNDCSRIAQDH